MENFRIEDYCDTAMGRHGDAGKITVSPRLRVS